MLNGRILSYSKKRKINQNGHSLPFVVTRCRLLSLAVSLVVTRSTLYVVTRFQLLSLVVLLVVTCCHLLSLDLSIVCLFINDSFILCKSSTFFFINGIFQIQNLDGGITYKKTDKWYIEWQWVTSSNDEWQRVVQRVTTNDNGWQRMITSGTTSDSKWLFWLIVLFFE